MQRLEGFDRKHSWRRKSRSGAARMRLLALTALLTTVLSADAEAQRRGRIVGMEGHGGRGYFQIGAAQLDVDEINAALTAAGYPAFEENFVSLGGAGLASRNRLLIGGEGHAVFQSSETSADGQFRTSLGGGYGMFNVGYEVFRSDGLSIYPLLGIGGGGTSLRIGERAVVDFDDVLAQPRRGVQLTNASLLLGGALGADWLLGVGTGRGGMVLSLRAGYNYAPLESDWSIDGTDVAGGPESTLSGFYVRLGFGGGRR